MNNKSNNRLIAGRLNLFIVMVFLCLSCADKKEKDFYDEGLAYYKQMNYEQAIIQFNKAIELDPLFEDAYQRLRHVYMEQNKTEQGLIQFNKLENEYPDISYPVYYQGLLLKESARYEEALKYCHKAIRLKPKIAAAWKMLVLIHDQAGSVEKAENYLKQAQKQNPRNSYAFYGMAFLHYIRFDYDSAMQEIKKALSINPDFIDAYFLKISALFNSGQYQAALAVADTGLQLCEAQKDYFYKNQFYTKKAQILWTMGDNESAHSNLNDALRIAREYGYAFNEIKTLNMLGLVYRVTSKPESALKTYRQALRLSNARGFNERNGILLANIGDVFITLSKYDSAMVYLQKALKLIETSGDIKNQAGTLSSIALVHSYQGAYVKALTVGQKAIALNRKAGDRYGETVELINFGAVYTEMGQYAKALDSHLKALKISRDVGDRYNEQICLNDIGEIYLTLGDFAKAKEHLESALAIALEINVPDHIAACTGNLGRVYLTEGDTSAAVERFKSVARQFGEIGYRRGQAVGYANLAKIYQDRRAYDSAAVHFERALAINKEIKNTYGEGMTRADYAALLTKRGQLDQAKEMNKAALAIGKRIRASGITSRADYGLAEIYMKEKNYERARQYCEQSIQSIEKMRNRLGTPGYKSAFLHQKINVYKTATQLCYVLFNKTADNTYLNDALRYTEMGKARTLLDLLTDADVTIEQGIDAQLLKRKDKLMNVISGVQTRLLSENLSEPLRNDLNEQLTQTEQQLENVQLQIGLQHPAYGALNRTPNVTVSDMQALLGPGEIMLEYVLGDTSGYVIAITGSQVNMYALPQMDKIAPLVNELIEIIDSPTHTNEDFSLLSENLYQILVAPVHDELKSAENLIIIPDGILHYLPFETLMSANHADSLSYLIETYNIRYAPSAAVYSFLNEEEAKKDDTAAYKNILAFGDPVFGQDERSSNNAGKDAVRSAYLQSGYHFDRLQYSAREIKQLVKYFPEGQTRVFLREKASEDRFKASADKPVSVLHIATHAIIDEQLPARSCIVLTLDDDPREDGFVQLREIFNMQLDCELVTLSACRTARGKLLQGEGFIGFTRALLYAGAHSIIVSHWPVSDYRTVKFMTRFYEFLQQGLDKAAALRKAKISLIRSDVPLENHPFYWAPFVLIGNK